MSAIQVEKRQRAATFAQTSGPEPRCGQLDVRWESPFDRLCFVVSEPELATRNNRRYTQLLAELTSGSGCTESEILAHGQKVRAVLFFAEARLTRDGSLRGLVGKEKYVYQLPCVTPAF